MNKNILDIYSEYLITQNSYATATGVFQVHNGQISRDKITGFLNSAEATFKDL